MRHTRAANEAVLPARRIVLARQRFDELPSDVKGALRASSAMDLPHERATSCWYRVSGLINRKQKGPLTPMNRLAEELRGIHVLVIDDDQLARHFLRSVLEFSGAIVTAAGTADALRAALIADVIVCDLASAEMAGREFLSQLQNLHVRLGRTVPAIALVPTGTKSVRVRDSGFRMYLIKPVDGDQLRATVQEAVRQ